MLKVGLVGDRVVRGRVVKGIVELADVAVVSVKRDNLLGDGVVGIRVV